MEAPRLRVPHPGPKTRAQLERLRRSEGRAGLSFGMSSDTVVVERALGFSVEDVDGNVFLDFVSGFGSINAGHCHPKVVEAVQEQAGKLHQAMSLASPVRLDLEEKVLSLVQGPAPKKILFGTSGSEAVETAIKLARRATGRQDIVGFTGGFHGRTLGALPFMGRKAQREGLGALVPGARHVPYPYPYRSPFGSEPEECVAGTIAYIEEFLKNPVSGWGEVAAILIEPVQGNGGMIPAPLGFLGALRRLCDRYGVLLILDEVMSGFARTGKMFAYQHEKGVEPDLLVLGKSLSGGLPLSACIAKKEVADASRPGTETGTYAGNVLACAAGLASIEVYEEENFSERAEKMGVYFLNRMGELAERHSMVGEVRGRGLMVAAELVADRQTREPLSIAKEASNLALKKGLFLYPGGHYRNVLAFMPPLLIGKEEIDTAVGIVGEILIELAARD